MCFLPDRNQKQRQVENPDAGCINPALYSGIHSDKSNDPRLKSSIFLAYFAFMPMGKPIHPLIYRRLGIMLK
jgi:hypothetical protein